MSQASLHAPESQPVTFVELFFDLVFVFAVTQLTGLTAHHLDAAGVARSGVLFWLIWWAWTQFTWTLSPADTSHTVVRVLTLAATSAAFAMAASVPSAFGDDALWFALPYVAIRLLGMWMQVRVDRERLAHERATSDDPDTIPGMSMRWIQVSLIGLVVVLAGAVATPTLRPWIWLAAIAVDLVAAGTAAGNTVWDLDTAHFSERHGLFVIIALGESLIVAGSAVTEDTRSTELVLAVAAVLAVACGLWWTYFGWLKESMERHFAQVDPAEVGPVARDAYSLAHYPLIGGIIGFAVAVEEIVLHPDEPAGTAVIASLAVGIALFVGSSALAYWRVTGAVLTARLAIVALTVVAVALVGGLDPVWPLAAVAAGLAAIIALEGAGHRPAAADAVELD